MTLSNLAKYPMTRSIARSLCNSWASCFDFEVVQLAFSELLTFAF